jgi:hypothetical protein
MFFAASSGCVAERTTPAGIDTMLSPVSFRSFGICFFGSRAMTVATFLMTRPGSIVLGGLSNPVPPAGAVAIAPAGRRVPVLAPPYTLCGDRIRRTP